MESTLHLIGRVLWFYFIGIPVGFVWLAVAWLACATIIGLPIGIWMVNWAPAIMTLKQEHRFTKLKVGDKTYYYLKKAQQTNLLIRIIYFILVGWWLSLLALKVAFIAAVTFIGIPVSFWIINRLPFVMTLQED